MLLAGVVLVSDQNTLHGQCLNDDHYFEDQEKNDPESHARMQDALEIWKTNKNNPLEGKMKAVYKIPVVVHVIHEYGTENISKLQIQDQIRILNEDFRRLNADTSNTRTVFQSVAADAEIEFVLASKDPNGNCTEGIVRVNSPLTNNARDNVKAVSYWPSDKYLNIWIVKSIQNSGDDPGVITLGYAQFPWDRNTRPSTDGIVVRADYFGSIGTAAGNNNAGRTATHEVGHWLGLFHTFQGGCNPPSWGEQIDDTPPVLEPSFGCPIGANTCNNDFPNLPDQVENYMDYANGSCQNMFTFEQKAMMHNMINSFRGTLVSASNATFTGISGGTGNCAPKADFSNEVRPVCQGNSLQFTNLSYNGTVGTVTWTFEGGSPAMSNSLNPTVSYNQAGIYKVTLEVSNANGSSTLVRDSVVVAYASVSPHGAPQMESFEGQSFPPSEWTMKASNGLKWESFKTAGSHGTASARVQISASATKGTTVQLSTKAVDMMAISDPVLTFDLAYARLQSASIDRFRVYSSIDCGITWTLIYQRAGVQMETGNLGTTNFIPNSGQWKKHTVSLNNYVGKRNLLLRFDVVTDLGGNVYFDNMNIGSISSVNGADNMDEFTLYPNPASKSTTVSFTSKEAGELGISVIDVSGKQVLVYPTRQIEAGRQETELNISELASGVYFVVTELNGQKTTRKLLIAN